MKEPLEQGHAEGIVEQEMRFAYIKLSLEWNFYLQKNKLSIYHMW